MSHVSFFDSEGLFIGTHSTHQMFRNIIRKKISKLISMKNVKRLDYKNTLVFCEQIFLFLLYIYMLKLKIETLEQGVKYVQS